MGTSGRAGLAIAALVLAAIAGLAFGGLLAGGGIGGGGSADDAGATASASSESSSVPVPGSLTLTAEPTTAAARAPVTLRGVLADAAAGVTITAQRQEGGAWTDFPADTTTGAGGSFELPIELGRVGPNVMRVVSSTGAASKPVTVTIS